MKTGLRLLLVCLLAFGLCGCSNIADDGTRTRTEGTLTGGVGGALLGGLTGFLVGGDVKGALIGAVGGAAVGAGAGYVIGNNVANKKAEYASREDWLDACIANAQSVNQQIIAQNAQLRENIAMLDAESTRLAAQYRAQQASQQQLRAEQQNLEKERKELESLISAYEQEVESQRTVVADARANNNTREADILEAEIANTQRAIAEMRQYNAQLATISARISV